MLVADIVFKLRPCVLQNGANLHLKGPTYVVRELFHCGSAIFGHGEHEVVGAVAKAAGNAGLGCFINGTLDFKRFTKNAQRFWNRGGVKQRDPHPHHIVDLLPRLGVDKIAVLAALFGLCLKRGPSLDAGRNAVEDDAGVIEEILDGGAEVPRSGGVVAHPVVVLVA